MSEPTIIPSVSINNWMFSREAYHLVSLSAEETKYLQTYEKLAGPNREMNVALRRKIGNRASWRHSVSETQTEELRLHWLTTPTLTARHLNVFKIIPVQAPLIARLLWKWMQIEEFYGAYLPRSTRLLCLGANSGLECAIASILFPEWSITGIDFKIPSPRFFNNLLEMPLAKIGTSFEAKSFDLVFSNHVVEHLGADRDTILGGVRMILKEKGILASVLPCETNPANPAIARFDTFFDHDIARELLPMWPSHMWKTDVFNLHDVLKQNGFESADFFMFKGSRADNEAAICAQLSEDMRMAHAESGRQTLSSLASKVLALPRHLASTRSLDEVRLKYFYHVEFHKFRDYDLIPEVLFVARNRVAFSF